MRYALTFLVLLNLGVWGYGHLSGATVPLELAMGTTIERGYRHQEIVFEGGVLLDKSDLAPLLPRDRSNFWWEFHRGAVGAALEEHPLVKSATVNRCGAVRWGCFKVAVVEREPEFVTEFGGKAWLVSADGAFMGRAPRAALQEGDTPRAGLNPVILKGLDFDRSSPDTLKARLDLIRTAIEVIEAGSGERVRTARLVGASDLEVRFEGLGYAATFGLPDGDTARLGDEVARYRRVAAELGEKHRLVRSIDLAFERVAVVSFIE